MHFWYVESLSSLQILDYFEYALFRTGQNWMFQQDNVACHIQCQYNKSFFF